MPTPRLILASASPRRQSLLAEAGYEFVVQPANIDEAAVAPNLLPGEVVIQLATTKARTIAEQNPEDVVLAADTVVAFGDRIIGKPSDAGHAREMLALLAGTTHLAVTGLAVICVSTAFNKSRRVMSAVRMKHLTAAEIDAYVATGEWQGKAGGYGIQDPDPFVTRISGSRSNIVGLPMGATRQLLAEAGIHHTARD